MDLGYFMGNMDCGSWIPHATQMTADMAATAIGAPPEAQRLANVTSVRLHSRCAAATIRRGRAEVEGIEMQEKLMAGEIEPVLPLEEELQEEQDR